MGNFIKLNRKITKWEWWHDIKTYRLFTYMLIEAWWKDGKYKGTDIQRGSFPSSVNELAQETDLTINEVRTALKHLKITGEITSKSQGKYTIFTVNNYNVYQSDNEQINNEITSKNANTSQANLQSDNKELTSNSQAINEQITSSNIKEDKKINNIKESEEDKEYKEVKKDKPKRKAAKVYYPNDEKLNQAFVEFVKMRKEIGKPLTSDIAFKRAMNKLDELAGDDNDLAIQIIEQSIFHCWQSFYELKDDIRKQNGNNKEEQGSKLLNEWRNA